MLEPTIAIITTPMVSIATGRGGNTAEVGWDGVVGRVGPIIIVHGHTAQQAQPSGPQKLLRSETGSRLDQAAA